jgi:hypothetical protein
MLGCFGKPCFAPRLPRNVETQNYATISGFENFVTFEMQRLTRFYACSRPSSKAAGHLGHTEASEDHSREVLAQIVWQGRIGPPVGGGEAATGL